MVEVAAEVKVVLVVVLIARMVISSFFLAKAITPFRRFFIFFKNPKNEAVYTAEVAPSRPKKTRYQPTDGPTDRPTQRQTLL